MNFRKLLILGIRSVLKKIGSNISNVPIYFDLYFWLRCYSVSTLVGAAAAWGAASLNTFIAWWTRDFSLCEWALLCSKLISFLPFSYNRTWDSKSSTSGQVGQTWWNPDCSNIFWTYPSKEVQLIIFRALLTVNINSYLCFQVRPSENNDMLFGIKQLSIIFNQINTCIKRHHISNSKNIVNMVL